MKVFELLNFNREPLKRLQLAGIRIEDVNYIDLYNDYQVMLNEGDKVSYIVALLADRYHVSERKVYMLIKRYGSECNSQIFGGGKISLLKKGLHSACSPFLSLCSAVMRKHATFAVSNQKRNEQILFTFREGAC